MNVAFLGTFPRMYIMHVIISLKQVNAQEACFRRHTRNISRTQTALLIECFRFFYPVPQGTTPRWVALEHIISLLHVTLEPRLSWDDLLEKSLNVDTRPHDKQAAETHMQRKGRL